MEHGSKRMTCEDCIHYDICLGAFGVLVSRVCDSFKDKSKFIELPCSIGDYCIYENKIWYILQITYFGSDDDFVLSLTDIVSSRFKKIFASDVEFISKEEAEKRLEELNEVR